LWNGDRIRAEVRACNAGGLRLEHVLLKERMVPKNLLKTLYPASTATVLDAGSDPESWLGLGLRGKPDLRNMMQKRDPGFGRVFLDGVFVNPPPQGSSWNFTGLSQVVAKRDRYELRCEITDAGGAEPYLSASLSGNNGTPSVQINLGHGQLRVYSYNFGGRGRPMQQERDIPLADRVPAQRTRREARIFVDTSAGTVDFMIDGVHLMRFGQQKNERAPGVGSQVSLSTYSMSGNASLLSNVWLGPWNGEVPRAGESGRGTSLNNGDFAAGPIGDFADGKVAVGEGAGAIPVPLDRITSIEFGGEPVARPLAGRIRLSDGSVINLDGYRLEQGVLTGESPAFGPIKFPVKEVAELIFSPSPARFPKVVAATKLAQKAQPNAGKGPQ
jgi:hypothetical protein